MVPTHKVPEAALDEYVPDGIETLPEPLDLIESITSANTDAEDALNEGLMETFPASDPVASGKFD